MILNMIGGGGGASLNFAIVGGTSAPESPKENTIWVNTETAITDWSLGVTAPDSPTEGMLWIAIGTASAVSFNALKKNCIQVYPLTANQYVEGAWVTKEARSYQNGEWHDWIIYLFTNGNQNESLTGGWSNSIDDFTTDGWDEAASDGVSGANWDASTVTIGETIVIDLNIGDNYNYKDLAGVSTRNAIDLTNYAKIKATCMLVNKSGQSGGAAYMGIAPTLVMPYRSDNFTAYVEIPEGTSELELDVSAITGSYRVLIGGYSGEVGLTITVTSITIE